MIDVLSTIFTILIALVVIAVFITVLVFLTVLIRKIWLSRNNIKKLSNGGKAMGSP